MKGVGAAAEGVRCRTGGGTGGGSAGGGKEVVRMRSCERLRNARSVRRKNEGREKLVCSVWNGLRKKRGEGCGEKEVGETSTCTPQGNGGDGLWSEREGHAREERSTSSKSMTCSSSSEMRSEGIASTSRSDEDRIGGVRRLPLQVQRARRRRRGARVVTRAADTGSAPSVASCTPPDEYWQKLRPKLGYLSLPERDVVKEALYVAYFAHYHQVRKSGEPYIVHPVEVCGILAEMEMDTDTLIAGLLHDTVEDTETVTFSKIQDKFGIVVRKIVEGETKVSKIGKVNRKGDRAEVKADDLKQMFLAMTGEIRVIIVKLADRLHNMRTLQHMSENKQKLISMETLDVFAPLAKLLGMYRVKEELEELALSYVDREAYHTILRRLDELAVQQEGVVVGAKAQLQEAFLKDPFLLLRTRNVQIETLNRAVYSIYKEAKAEGIPFEDVRDVAVIRVKMDIDDKMACASFYGTANQVCYHVLGMIHAMWTPLPERVKDFIAMPKPNGYRGIHTTVLPRDADHVFPLRLQIRTMEMDRVAEFGITAEESVMNSWKDNSSVPGEFDNGGTPLTVRRRNSEEPSSIAKKMAWLNAIQEWQDEFVGNMTAREFVDTVTGDLLGSKVFVFTPRGETVNLPKGATIIDYAYQIHSDLGNKMVAAKVNGKLRPPEYRLRNGEMVDIITYGDGVNPSRVQVQHHRDWLSFAKTRRAIHKITKFLKQNEHLLDHPEDLDYEEFEKERYIDDNLVDGPLDDDEDDDVRGPLGTSMNGISEATPAYVDAATASEHHIANGLHINGNAMIDHDFELTDDMTTSTLILQCTDRVGLLTDVAGVISKNGISIQNYWGSEDKKTETFYMNFEVAGVPSEIDAVVATLREVPGVRSYNLTWIKRNGAEEKKKKKKKKK